MRRLSPVVAVAVLAVLAVSACQDQGPRVERTGPQFGSHIVVNPSFVEDFWFLGPINQSPPPVPTDKEFHSALAPVVEICYVGNPAAGKVATDPCAGDVARFVRHADPNEGGATGLVALVESSTEGTHFRVKWDPTASNPDGLYRVYVSTAGRNEDNPPAPVLGTTVFGAANIQITTNAGGATQFTRTSGANIKFAVYEGALCPEDEICVVESIGQSGGLLELFQNDNALAQVFFPPGALTQNVNVFLKRHHGQQQNGNRASALVRRMMLSGQMTGDPCIPLKDPAAEFIYNELGWSELEELTPDKNFIQFEGCYTLYTEPYIEELGVPADIHICLEEKAENMPLGDLRLLKVREDVNGTMLPDQISDLGVDYNGSPQPGFDCSEPVPVGTAFLEGATGLLDRLAQRAAQTIKPLAQLIGPRPLHAKKRRTGTIIGGRLTTFSRIGTVLPVAAEFDPAGQVNGVQNTTIKPKVTVTTAPYGDRAPELLSNGGAPVPDIGVSFSIVAGGGSLLTAADVFTNAFGVATVDWRLGAVADQRLLAEVFHQREGFPNYDGPWASHTFVVDAALNLTVSFLSPIGTASASTQNLKPPTIPVPQVMIKQGNTVVLPETNATLQTASGGASYWQVNWATPKTASGLYNLSIEFPGTSIPGTTVNLGPGQYNPGRTLPVKFTVLLTQ